MERAQAKFENLFKVAMAYQQYMNIYMFLKECAFRGIFTAFQTYKYNPDEKIKIDHLYNSFQQEISQYNWSFYQMTKQDYQGFLEYYYNTLNYDSTDKSVFEVAKDVTENVGLLGTIDELTQKRIDFFNNKINKLSGIVNDPMKAMYGQQNQYQQSATYNQNQKPMNQPQSFGVNNNSMGNPMGNQFQQPQSQPQIQPQQPQIKPQYPPQQNQINQQKMQPQPQQQQYPPQQMNLMPNQPQIQYQNPYQQAQSQPYSGKIPKLVKPEFRLPMSKRDPSYPKLKEQIEEHIEYSNLELDYHKLDFGREHLEAAAYYLRNIID